MLLRKNSIILLFTFLISVQTGVSKPRTSRYEFWWALVHPIAALKVKKVYRKVARIYNENELKGKLDVYSSGGKLDAFRHIYYFAAFAQKIGPKKVIKLGKAHERTNYLHFKRGKKEDEMVADSLSCVMDLLNNDIGVKLGRENRTCSLEDLKLKVIGIVNNGDAYTILRDKDGRFIDCKNNVIDMSLYKGKWFVPKCITGYKAALQIE